MARKPPGMDRVRAYAAARKKSKGGHLGDLEAVAERMRELAEELRTVSDRTRVFAIAEERKVLAGLVELYGAADQISEMDRLSTQLRLEREERARMESGVEFTDVSDDDQALNFSGGTQ